MITTWNGTKAALALTGVVFLANCGGGSTSAASFAEVQSEFLSISEQLDPLDPTDPLPSTGQVSYAGSAVVLETAGALSIEDTGDIEEISVSFLALGEVDLDVDFGTSQLSGSATNFYELTDPDAEIGDNSAGTSIAGTLTFDTDGNVTGSLTKLDGEVATYTMTDGEAGFFGPNAELVVGAAVGQSSASGRADLNAAAVFGAERQ